MVTEEFINYVQSCALNSNVTSTDFSFLYNNMGMNFVFLNTFSKA